MKKFNLHKMELNELLTIDKNLNVRRVPGGWVFEYMNPNVAVATAVFVPWNEEFKGRPIGDD